VSDSSVRSWLAEQLKPLLPEGWRLLEVSSLPDTLSTVTVVLKHLGMRPLAEAPKGHLLNEVVVTIADPHGNLDKADDELDNNVLDLVHALDSVKKIIFTEAKKVLVDERWLGWDITCSTITRKKEPTNG